ncbi:AAA family ATPase [Agrobacterium vitis]|uniref:AAA family ATPase n=2 Tax=Agrobacterium vitis TaxID=373 RepID=UPI003D2CF740
MFFFDHERRHSFRPISLDTQIDGYLDEIRSYFGLPESERLQTDVPPVWKYTFEPDVLEHLTTLSHGKCPFCERRELKLHPYRFRPPAYATPSKGIGDKLSYLWLAFNWENLFPICADCTPTDKSYFRVKGRRLSPPSAGRVVAEPLDPGLRFDENAVLYFPGELDQPYKAFKVNTRGELIDATKRVPETIAHFKLNRPELVEMRVQAIRKQNRLLRRGLIFDSDEQGQGFETVEFGGSRYIFLVELAGRLHSRFGQAESKTPSGLPLVFRAWMQRTEFSEALNEALEKFDGQLRVPTPVDFAVAPIAVASTQRELVLDHPRLVGVQIKNFKSLENIAFDLPEKLSDAHRASALSEEVSEVPEAPCVLILGENSTGKSSILEAIALTCMPDELRNELGNEPADFTTNPEFMGEAPTASQNERYQESSVELRFQDKRVLRLEISARGKGRMSVLREGAGDTRPPLVFAYGAHRLYGKQQRDDALSHVDTLFKDDRHISNPEPWLIELSKSQPEALNEVVSALRHIIQIDGAFENIVVRQDPASRREKCFIRIKKDRQDGTQYILGQRLDVASSGYKAVLAVVCDIFRTLLDAANMMPRVARDAHVIVLIDEIEAHLHPRWKLQIISGLRRALPKATFILTSHDPLCVRGMFSGEVMMLNRYQNEGEKSKNNLLPEVVERVADFGNIGALTVEQLLTSDMFQLFSTDDRRTELAFARVADILSRQKRGDAMSTDDKRVLSDFRQEIGGALPYGRSQVSVIVQEALAEYLSDRRSVDTERRALLRDKAKKEIKDFLKEFLE